jgi:hypothetical protein
VKSVTKPQGTNIFSVEGGFLFYTTLEMWVIGTPELRDCEIYPLKTGFRSAQVPFTPDFTVIYSNLSYVPESTALHPRRR